MQLSTGPPSFALCGGKSFDKSQENCCGGAVYNHFKYRTVFF